MDNGLKLSPFSLSYEELTWFAEAEIAKCDFWYEGKYFALELEKAFAILRFWRELAQRCLPGAEGSERVETDWLRLIALVKWEKGCGT